MMHTRFRSLTFIVFVLALCSAACSGPESDETRTFLLRTDTMEISEVSADLIMAILAQLEQSQSLREGFPILGGIDFESDPSDPSVQIMRCTAVHAAATDTPCILLNELGDFIKTDAITWESARFYMYKVYVAPKSIFARVNPVKDFVAIEVSVFEELDLWQVVEEAIRGAAAKIGARPFHP
ncbi:MAG: hypothetical protein PVF70_10120 [Anaerolineales bacterium]|jgi:hypothetical protein